MDEPMQKDQKQNSKLSDRIKMLLKQHDIAEPTVSVSTSSVDNSNVVVFLKTGQEMDLFREHFTNCVFQVKQEVNEEIYFATMSKNLLEQGLPPLTNPNSFHSPKTQDQIKITQPLLDDSSHRKNCCVLI